MKIEISNRTKKKLRTDYVKKIVRETVLISRVKPDDISLSIVFEEKSAVWTLNRNYRKKDTPTDILSFDYSAGYNGKKKILEGELVLCPTVIAEDAKRNKVPFSREFVFVLSHGILHLLGMRHSKKMYEIQDKVVEKIIKN